MLLLTIGCILSVSANTDRSTLFDLANANDAVAQIQLAHSYGHWSSERFNRNKANYWLNAVIFNDETSRDEFLKFTNSNGVMTRPIWGLMNELEMFKNCPKGNLSNSEWLEKRVVNITSSVRI